MLRERPSLQAWPPDRGESLRAGLVNLDHLDRLSGELTLAGGPGRFPYIYCEAPDYLPVGAPGEGIAALDDAARAALVYLDFWAATGQRPALARARATLNFVLALAAEGGAFYNFILDEAGTINRRGITSRSGLDWWACRALWALARGYAVFQSLDRPYAARLRAAYLATEGLLAARIGPVGRFIRRHGLAVPAWLPADSAALAALAALALAEFQAAAPNARTARLLTALADGLAAYALGGPGAFPWGLHPHSLDAPLPWHAWGAHEAHALAVAGVALGRPDWVAAARREVDGFFAWQLANGRLHALDPLPVAHGQQVYGVNCMVQAALACHRATGDPRYARMAGLHAAWLTGNNPAHAPLYDPATGRGYDGIDGGTGGADAYWVNPHAGAESTIESLLALQAVAAVPEALRYLHHRPLDADRWQVIRRTPHDAAPPTAADAPLDFAFTVAATGDYLLYLGRTGQDSTERDTPLVAQLDAGARWTIPPAPPDRDCPWLDPIAPEPVHLTPGPHRLRLAPCGDTAATIAGILVQPSVATRRFVGPDGPALTLAFDLATGVLDWRE